MKQKEEVEEEKRKRTGCDINSRRPGSSSDADKISSQLTHVIERRGTSLPLSIGESL